MTNTFNIINLLIPNNQLLDYFSVPPTEKPDMQSENCYLHCRFKN